MLLEIEQCNAGYGRIEVLHDVHLHVLPGEIVGMIGPNGAGKSTVLNAIMGRCDVTHGRIRFQGADILREPVHGLLAKGLAYVPQGRLMFPSLTVEENLVMGGYTIRRRDAIEDRLKDLYERFPQLLTLRSRRAGTCSGGQQQLIAIARALMVSPALLLLDEPSLGLSPTACAEVYATIARLRADGVSMLIVEQNVHLVLAAADRIIALANGTVRAVGPPAEFADRARLQELYFSSSSS